MQKKVKALVAVGALCAACVSGTVFAYLTDTKSSPSMDFTVGEVTGTLSGISDSISADLLVPDELVEAAPVLTSTGNVDTIAILELTVPKGDFNLVSGNSVISKTDTELFDIQGLDTENWVEFVPTGFTNQQGESKTFYACKNVLTANAASTTAAFSGLRFVNAVGKGGEGIANDEEKVVVKADFIQADGFIGTKTAVDADVAKSAYAAFYNQNQ